MPKDELSGWLAPGAAIKLNGRLYGADADALRAVASAGDSPTDAIKKLLVLAAVQGGDAAQRELEQQAAFAEREAALIEAGRLREDALRAEIVEGARAQASMGRDLARLVTLTAQLSQHVAMMQSAQAETAHAAKAAAAECGLIRQNILGDLPDLRKHLAMLADQSSFLNSFFAALSDGVEPGQAAEQASPGRVAGRG